MHFTVVLGGLSVGLLNFGDKVQFLAVAIDINNAFADNCRCEFKGRKDQRWDVLVHW